MRLGQVYARDYEDLIDNAENTWKFWAQDNANLDAQAWRGGQCIQANPNAGSFPYTSGFIGTVLLDQTYALNVPHLSGF